MDSEHRFLGHEGSYSFNTTVESLLATGLPNLRRSTRFREQMQYTNIGYMILGALPSIIWNTTEPFAQLVKRHILDPLDMKSTTYSFARASEGGNFADGFTRLANLPRGRTNHAEELSSKNAWQAFAHGEVKLWPYWDSESTENGDLNSPVGGLMSSAQDLVRVE